MKDIRWQGSMKSLPPPYLFVGKSLDGKQALPQIVLSSLPFLHDEYNQEFCNADSGTVHGATCREIDTLYLT